MTRGSDDKPTKRLLVGYQGAEYVVELRKSLILVRPKGSRTGSGAEISITPSALHDRLLAPNLDALRRRTRSRR